MLCDCQLFYFNPERECDEWCKTELKITEWGEMNIRRYFKKGTRYSIRDHDGLVGYNV